MKKIDQVLNQVLDDIIPNEFDIIKVRSLVQDLEKKLILECKKAGIKANIELAGSIAKDTWLRKDPDIDIFIRLSQNVPKENLGKIILGIAKRATKGSKQIERYAEHPYLETIINNIRVNIVPCYHVENGNWISATDRTPYHTKYVKKNLTNKLKNEVRLLKKFLKGINVYGAEIKTGGFSGYLCELLVITYGSFLKILRTFSKYNKTIIVDLKNSYFHQEKELTRLFSDPLIMIDPVDKYRNVASALKSEKLYRFIGAARAFIKNPSKKFFFPPNINIFSLDTLKSNFISRGSSVIFILFDRIDAVPDVLWGQLYRFQNLLKKLLNRFDFKILRDSIWTNEKDLTVIIIELEHHILPKVKEHTGPPLEFIEQCNSFLSKYSNNVSVVSGPYIKDKRWKILLNRNYSQVKRLLKEKLTKDNQNIGIPKLISKALNNKLQILIGYEIVGLYQKNNDFAGFLSSFLIGKPFWL